MRSMILHALLGLGVAQAHLGPHQQLLQQQESLGEESALVQDELTVSSTLRDALLADSVIPEVLDDFEPKYYLDLDFSSRHRHDHRVLLGNTIKPKHVQTRPTFTFHSIEGARDGLEPETDHSRVFTLILTDPDAKSRANPKWSEMCHWIMTNLTTPLPGDPPLVLDLDVLSESKLPGELVSYKPPGPPPKTGPHRYVFVLLEGEQTRRIQAPEERKHWGYGKKRHGVRDWAKDNGLTVVGANYFFAHHKKQ